MPTSAALAARLSPRPDLFAAIAGAVAEEDLPGLLRLLRGLGLRPSQGEVEALLDRPGPFTPAFCAAT